jgi:TfoX/Sxy family transcriptional regulator of competence genes
VQRYIKGELVTIPLYLSIDEVIALHKQSPTYIDKKAAEADAVESAKSDAEDNAVEEQQLEGISEF